MEAGHVKLLAIDDNQDNLTTLKAVVRDVLPGCTLLTALDGAHGMERARTEDPDVILLDIVMPGMDGFEVCRRLKADELLRSIPVVFLTALRTDRESRVQALEAGAEGFLSKPLDEQELVAQVRAMAKLKAANRLQRLEKEELAALVIQRTHELEQELAERKRAEDTLKRSERRFRTVSRLSSDFAYSCVRTAAGAYVVDWITDTFYALTGFSEGELRASRCWMTLTQPADGDAAMEPLRRLQPGECDTQDVRIVTKDGRILTVTNHLECEADPTVPGGMRVYGAAQDITERKRAEEQLRESEQKFQKTFHSSPVALSLTTVEDGCFLDVNAALLRMLERDREEVLGHTSVELQVWLQPEQRAAIVAQLKQHGTVHDVDLKVRAKSGDIRDILWSAEQVVLGGEICLLASALDVTERKQAETSLRESEERFRGFIENANDFVYALTPDGRFTYMSPNWRELMEEPAAAAIGQSLERYLHPDDVPLCREFLQRVGNTTKPLGGLDYRVVRPDGSIRWHCSKGSACRDEKGHLIGYLGIARDITERKQIEETQAFLAQASGPTNDAFFNSLARYLARSLGMDFVCIDRLEGDGLTARTVANWCDGQFADNVTYALPDTPCGQAVGKLVCCFPANVRQLFPRDLVLQELRAESYAGVTLWSHVGRPIGLIALIGRSPLANRSLVEATLQLVAARAAGELERQQVEESLRDSETRHRLLVENLNAGVVVHAPDTSIRFANPMAARLLGLTQDEMVGKRAPDPSWGFFQEDGTRLAVEEYPVARLLATLKPISGQVVGVNRPRTNDRAWVLVSGYPIFRENHVLEEAVISFVDITERKRAETALRESEERLTRAQRSAGVGMWDWDLATEQLIWSPQLWRLFGLEPTLSPTFDIWRNVLHLEDRQAAETRINDAIRDHQPLSNEYRIVTASGEVRWISSLGDALYDEHGQALRMSGICIDVTERKQAEEALRESQEQLSLVLEGSQLGFWDWNLETDQVQRNARWAEMLGYSLQEIELTVTQWSDLHHPDDRAAAWQSIQDHLAGRTPMHQVEYRMRTKDGQYRWVLDQARVVKRDPQGKPRRMTGTHTDITERKQAEEALRSALREKESLLREVHHRVKNNLQVISSLVRLQAGQFENPSTRAALQDMQNRIRSMALLHETLYRSGNLAQVNLVPYLQALCAQLFRSLVARPGSIQLRLNVASVYLDANQAVPCGLLVNELVSNCLKHAFPEGRVGEVLVEVQPVDGGPTVRLRVADNGVGLPADFDLQRLHSLGLHLVSDLAGQLQGRLEIGRGGIASCQPAAGRGSDGVIGDALNESQPATEQPITIVPATGAVVEVIFTPPPYITQDSHFRRGSS